MCSICHRFKCPSECPNHYEFAVGSCDDCKCDFFEGDKYIEFDTKTLCQDCLSEMTCYDECDCCVCGEHIEDGDMSYLVDGKHYCCDCVKDCECEA